MSFKNFLDSFVYITLARNIMNSVKPLQHSLSYNIISNTIYFYFRK